MRAAGLPGEPIEQDDLQPLGDAGALWEAQEAVEEEFGEGSKL
jgi:hypothetical protein